MSRKISWNICRGIATSAIWKATQRPWLKTFAPILINLSRRLISDQSLIGSGVASVRRNFSYQAGSWTKPRRVIAKVEWHPAELYPRVGFIVTNMSRPAERVVAFYNKRGTITKDMPGKVLGKHGIAERDGEEYRLAIDPSSLSSEERDELVRLCDEAISAYLASDGIHRTSTRKWVHSKVEVDARRRQAPL